MLGDKEGAGDIDGENTVPFIEARLLDGLFDLDAGSIDKDIKTPGLRRHMIKGRDDAFLAGDIKLQET